MESALVNLKLYLKRPAVPGGTVSSVQLDAQMAGGSMAVCIFHQVRDLVAAALNRMPAAWMKAASRRY